jgi:predicted nucleic acid-binding protein
MSWRARVARASCHGSAGTNRLIYVASGAFVVKRVERADLVRATELDARHAHLERGLVDCVVAAVAERIGAAAIATLDGRDFSVLAPG